MGSGLSCARSVPNTPAAEHGDTQERGAQGWGEAGFTGWRWDGNLHLYKLLPCSGLSLLIWYTGGRST